eukprot:COSAG01_NODE_1542_length_9973_cov_11.546992_5_plen_252_part_00
MPVEELFGHALAPVRGLCFPTSLSGLAWGVTGMCRHGSVPRAFLSRTRLLDIEGEHAPCAMQDCRLGSGAQGPEAMRVARAMQQLWTSFAKTGTPSADPALLSLSSSSSRDTGGQWPVWGGGGVDGAAEPVMAFGGSEVGLTSSAFKQQDCSLLHEHVHGTASRLLPWLQGFVAGLLPWLAVASWVHMGWLPSPLRRQRVESLLPPAEDLDGESSAPPRSWCWCWWRRASKWELWLGEQSPHSTDEVAPPN